MELTDRQKQILRAIVDIYVSTAEPVGSKAIAALPDVSCSSATIRNEMAELTQMGLLEQPHTSAGRIPSPAGYRFYIDELMQDYRLSLDETKSLHDALQLKSQEFDEMMSQVGKLVSKMTDLPAYAIASRQDQAVAKHFELVSAGKGSIILVLMLSGDEVKNKLIKLPVTVTDADLRLLSAVLNSSMTDLTTDEITAELLDKVSRTAGPAASLVPLVMDYTLECLRQQHGDFHVAGQMRLLNQPEFRDVAKAREVIESLDEDVLANLPATLPKDGPVQFLVGPENVARELKDSSVVMMRFDIGDGMQGTVGVVGPTRMDYAKITAKLGYFAENLGRMFQKNGGAENALPALGEGKPGADE